MARRKHFHDGDPRGRKLRFEALEERSLLAGDLELLKDINLVGAPSALTNLTAVHSTLFFTANDGIAGQELWKSDGTEAGTLRVKDIRAVSFSASPSSLTNVGGTLYFSADDGVKPLSMAQHLLTPLSRNSEGEKRSRHATDGLLRTHLR